MVDASSYCYRDNARAAFDDFDQPPAFGFRDRSSLFDTHAVTHLRLRFLVMGIELLVAGHDFLEFRMGKSTLDAHYDRLCHLVGNDFPHALFTMAAGLFRLSNGLSNGFRHTNF